MPLLLDASDDVAELLRVQMAARGKELHHVRSVAAAVRHLEMCVHDALLVGGEITDAAWHKLFEAVPVGARTTLWSSHPASRLPKPPADRQIRTDLLLGMPRVPALVARLLPEQPVAVEAGGAA